MNPNTLRPHPTVSISKIFSKSLNILRINSSVLQYEHNFFPTSSDCFDLQNIFEMLGHPSNFIPQYCNMNPNTLRPHPTASISKIFSKSLKILRINSPVLQ